MAADRASRLTGRLTSRLTRRLTGRLAGRPAGWWRRRGLRARLTLGASAGLAVALAAAGLLLVNALRVSLTRGLDDTARQAAFEVAALANAHRLPYPVPVAAGTITMQVLGASGRIIDASPGADLLVPILQPAVAKMSAQTGRARLLAGPPFGIPGLLRVVAVGTRHHQIVIAAVSYAQVSNSLAVATKAVLIGGPLLFALLAVAVWLITGAALRPIEELRRGAQEITDTATARTLPMPEARDEVYNLAVTLNDMLARLAAAQQRQRALVSDAAHELRSPIASIRTQLEVAVDHPQARDWQQTAVDVLADTLRLARLAEDLLALAQLDERAGQPVAGRPVDLASLARQVSLRYAEARVPVITGTSDTSGTASISGNSDTSGTSGADKVSSNSDTSGTSGADRISSNSDTSGRPSTPSSSGSPAAGGGCVVSGDPGSLDRMLVNLIDNAVRYARSRVTVTARADGEYAVLLVADDGPGIPPEEAERVFDRFTRLDDARSRSPDSHDGSGLGLAIVRATAAAHGGTAWLEAAAPGLRAIVRLPAAPGQQGGDGDSGEQQGQVGDGQVEQPHRSGAGG